MPRKRPPRKASPKAVPLAFRGRSHKREQAASHLWHAAEMLGELGQDARMILWQAIRAEKWAREEPALGPAERIKKNPRILDAPSIRGQIYELASKTEVEDNRQVLSRIGIALASRRGRDKNFKHSDETGAITVAEHLMRAGIPESQAMEVARQAKAAAFAGKLMRAGVPEPEATAEAKQRFPPISLAALRMRRSRLKEKLGRKTLKYQGRKLRNPTAKS